MKELIIFLLLTMFLAVSCHSSKKAENNDTDILPDEDLTDVDENGENEDDEAVKPDKEQDDETTDEDEIVDTDPCVQNPCENFANSDGTCGSKKDGSFECGCVDGYFWGHLGCKKITFANICTGQEKCYFGDDYDAKPLQKCPREDSVIYGQDAQYAENGYCFKKDFELDRSVKDEVTHVNNGLHLEWMQAESGFAAEWKEALNYCDNLDYGGHDDWRLPMPKELMTMVKHIETFEDQLHLLWSSVPLPENSSLAWYLNKMLYIGSAGKTSKFNVRCARGDGAAFSDSKPEPGRFRVIDVNGKEMLHDSQSGILWMKEYSKEYDWIEALPYCERSNYAGFSDWRLPNIYELTSLINYKYERLSEFPLAETISSEQNSSFWSSTTNAISGTPSVYGVDLKSGIITNLMKDRVKARAICIRNEPCKEGWWWNGENCVENPCSDNPCKGMEHSDGTCGSEDFKSYFCGCTQGWFWDGSHCAENPCEPNPCGNYENSTGECRAENSFTFICGCGEGWWWGKNEGCVAERPHQRRICTGQTKCYDMEKEIVCPVEGEDFFGQDSQYARLGYCTPQNFLIDDSVENEPIVIDKNTGLEWQQKFSSTNYSGYCSNLTYGGYSDWRLPTLAELLTLLYYDYSPTINLKYFPDTPPEIFWTSGSCNINFEKAEIIAAYVNSGFTRCVRGEDFEENRGDIDTVLYEDGYLYTNHTMNLMWTSFEPEYYYETNIWSERMKYCEDLNFAGFSDWRLPNIRELTSISLERCWLYYGTSSTTMPWHPAEYFGDVSYKDETDHYYICIRENPCADGKVWDHGKCVDNICVPNPCAGVENSYEGCGTDSSTEAGYICGCNDGYLWDSDGLRCVFKTDRCDPNPCEGIENGTGECFQPGPYEQNCGCIEGYKWDGWNDVCKKDD
ncbi:DUF1566 domain-containing protein [bacterium]|nr:DUF1566 domain-containing protein [bacterium]